MAEFSEYDEVNPRCIKRWGVTWPDEVNTKLLKRAHHHVGSNHKMQHFIIIVDVEKTNGFIMVKAYVSTILIALTAESTDWTIIENKEGRM